MSKKAIIYALKDGKYLQIGIYNFLKEEFTSNRFNDLVINIKNIDLINEDDY